MDGQNETCRLCDQQKPLQKSHIIPNAYFRHLKRHDGYAIQGEITPGVPIRKAQESWSKKLFCWDCEQLISNWERYAITFTRNPKLIGVTVTSTCNKVTYTNVDYKTLRLFQLSILFRAAVAPGREYFYITLSENHLSELKTILLGKAPLPNKQFGCQMHLLKNPSNNSTFDGFVGMPEPWTEGVTKIIPFVFGGFTWEFHIPRLSHRNTMQNLHLKENGALQVDVISCYEYTPVLKIMDSMMRKESLGVSKLPPRTNQ